MTAIPIGSKVNVDLIDVSSGRKKRTGISFPAVVVEVCHSPDISRSPHSWHHHHHAECRCMYYVRCTAGFPQVMWVWSYELRKAKF